MRYGFVLTSIVKLLLFGIAGSGKTSVTAIMMGDDPPQVHKSTSLMARPVQVITVFINQLTEWQRKTPEEVLRIIAEIIRSREAESYNHRRDSTTPNTEQVDHTKQVQPAISEAAMELSHAFEQVQLSTREKAIPLYPHSEQGQANPTILQQPKSKSKFDFILESAVKEGNFLSLVHNSSVPSQPILKQKWLYIIDSGGQPEFHNMLSIFLHKTTACIFVFRMHEGLDEYPPIAFHDDTGTPVAPPHHSRVTNRQIFQQFIHTMRSFGSNINGGSLRIVLLATHRDLVEACTLPQLLEEKHKQLKAIVLPQFKDQLIYCDEQLEEFIFTMNAKQPEKEDRETANVIRERVTQQCPGEEVKVPMRWYILDHRSKKISRDLNRKVLSREEYGRIAESLDIDEESCEEALKFFNSLNTILYFPKVLPNLGFLDPQILLDKLSELVAKSYQMNQEHKPAQPRPIQAMMPKKYHFQFRDFAQVTEELLNEFAEHYHPPHFTSQELVTLFEKLLIFGKLRKGVWFVPSMLPFLKEEVEQYRVSKERALLINFPDGGPQNGIFCSMVSFLLSPDNESPCPWEVLMDDDKPVCLKRNVIGFTVEKFPGEVNLIEEWTHFEVHVKTSPVYERDLWQLVYKAVFNGLEKAAETHHYSDIDNVPQPAIVCPKHYKFPSIPHSATIDNQGNWKCTQCSRWFGPVSTEAIPWLNLLSHTSQLEPPITHQPHLPKSTTPTFLPSPLPPPTLPSLPLTKPVTLPQLLHFKTKTTHINIVEKIGTHYMSLGPFLLNDDTGTKTEAIRDECKLKTDSINHAILSQWLQGKGKTPVNWRTLIDTLKIIGLSKLGEEIEECV